MTIDIIKDRAIDKPQKIHLLSILGNCAALNIPNITLKFYQNGLNLTIPAYFIEELAEEEFSKEVTLPTTPQVKDKKGKVIKVLGQSFPFITNDEIEYIRTSEHMKKCVWFEMKEFQLKSAYT